MKTRIQFALALPGIAILAASCAYAQHKAGQYESGDTGKIARKLSRNAATDASYDFGPFQLYGPNLPGGNGRQEVYVYCNNCHSPIYITMQPPLPADIWTAEVTKMRKTFGADIPDDAANKIVHYLQTNFTPDTRKR